MRKLQVNNHVIPSSGISLNPQEKALSKVILLSETAVLPSVPQSSQLSPASTSTFSRSQAINSSKFTPKSTTIATLSTSRQSNSAKFEVTYARMQAYEAQQQHLLKRSIKKAEEVMKKTHPHQPVLDKISEKLSKGQSPLQIRYKEVITHKKQKIRDMISKIKADKEEELKKELTFHPKICESIEKTRTTEEYYNYMRSWKSLIEENDEKKREVSEERVLQGVTFKPLLNRNSEMMSKDLPSFEKRLELGIKMKERKLNEKRSVSPCTFRPHLECSYKKLSLKPVFARLYTPPISFSCRV